MENTSKSFVRIKQEISEQLTQKLSEAYPRAESALSVIDLSSSDSDSDDDDDASDSDDNDAGADGNADVNNRPKKKKKIEESQVNMVLPLGFLDPLPPKEPRLSSPAAAALALPAPRSSKVSALRAADVSSKQFWKAGDYDGASSVDWESSSG
ncbi:hypothetical protein M9H77_04567 [Catharanthus roseus]|nr:hypothetical protein M9H77_04567 [Catharanthus roseus]